LVNLFFQMATVRQLEKNLWIHIIFLIVLTFFIHYLFKEQNSLFLCIILSFYFFFKFCLFLVCLSAFDKADFSMILPKFISNSWKHLICVLFGLYSVFVFALIHFHGIAKILQIFIGIQTSIFVTIVLFVKYIPNRFINEPEIFFFDNLKISTLFNLIIWSLSKEGLNHFYNHINIGESDGRSFKAKHITFRAPLSLQNLPTSILKDIDSLDAEINENWIVNPSLLVKNILFSERIRRLTDYSALYQVGKHFVIEDPGYKMIYHYGVDKYDSILSKIVPGKEIPQNIHLGDMEIKLFKYTNIFVKKDYWKSRCSFYEKFIEKSRFNFNRNHYTILPDDIFHPIQLHLFEVYCEDFRKSLDENSFPNEYLFSWENCVASHYNLKLLEIVSDITQKDLDITRPLILFYKRNSDLTLHIDGHPFVYSCSVCSFFNSSKLSLKKNSIPQNLSFISSNFNEMVDVNLERGECILFKGQECPHYRKPGKSPNSN
jgi:hypothetical protein